MQVALSSIHSLLQIPQKQNVPSACCLTELGLGRLAVYLRDSTCDCPVFWRDLNTLHSKHHGLKTPEEGMQYKA